MGTQSITFRDDVGSVLKIEGRENGFDFMTADTRELEVEGSGVYVGIDFQDAKELYEFIGRHLRKAEEI